MSLPDGAKRVNKKLWLIVFSSLLLCVFLCGPVPGMDQKPHMSDRDLHRLIHGEPATHTAPAAPPAAPPQPRKDLGLAVALCFFFGPLGLLYSSPVGAIVLTLAAVPICVVSFGLGLIGVYLFAILWAVYAVQKHNDRA